MFLNFYKFGAKVELCHPVTKACKQMKQIDIVFGRKKM